MNLIFGSENISFFVISFEGKKKEKKWKKKKKSEKSEKKNEKKLLVIVSFHTKENKNLSKFSKALTNLV